MRLRSGVIEVRFEGSTASAWIVGTVFMGIGLLMVTGAVFGSVARTVIREDADALVVTLRAFGFHYRVRRLPRSEIEEVAVKPSTDARSRGGRRRGVGAASRTRARSQASGGTEVVIRTR
jgi:hypothetical protein